MSLHRRIATVMLLSFALGLGACSPSTTDTKDTSTNVNSGKEANSKAQNKTLDSDSELYKTVVAGLGDGKDYTYTPGKGAPDITNFVVEKDPLGRPIVKATITNNYTMKLPLTMEIQLQPTLSFMIIPEFTKEFSGSLFNDKYRVTSLQWGESKEITMYVDNTNKKDFDFNSLQILLTTTPTLMKDENENQLCTQNNQLEINEYGWYFNRQREVRIANNVGDRDNLLFTYVNSEGTFAPKNLETGEGYYIEEMHYSNNPNDDYIDAGYIKPQALYVKCK